MVIRRARSLKLLTTASAVIDALGGLSATASLTGKGYTAVHNWFARGRIAPDTFLVMTQELAARGFAAPSTLWGITPAKSVARR